MTIVFNLLCKAFIAILDILLLDFYLKNVYKDIYIEKFKKTYYFIYIIIIITSIIFITNIITSFIVDGIFTLILTLFFRNYHIPLQELLIKFFNYYLLKHIIILLCFIGFSFIFDSNLFISYVNYNAPYITFTYIIAKYFIFITLNYVTKAKYNIMKFKVLCIILLIYFCLNILLNNPALFFIPAIARTYIFTVIISIIALICFDRMQTKYEKDKHLQESIIQNLEKEKEFNQQREQQQKEIRKINHNLNNILIILQSHLEKEEYEEAKDYIEQNLKTHVEAYQALTHTGIAAIDGALNAHIQSIKEKGIQYDEDISKILHLGSIVPGDLALIISLALDNAKEACENIEGEKHISLKLQSKQTHVILYIENSIPEGSHPSFHKTSKKDKIAHGFGVSSIKEMAERYHGEAKYEVKHDQVILRVVLQK